MEKEGTSLLETHQSHECAVLIFVPPPPPCRLYSTLDPGIPMPPDEQMLLMKYIFRRDEPPQPTPRDLERFKKYAEV